MNKLLDPIIQQFIEEHTGSDLVKLALKPNPFADIAYNEIIQQIAARTKAKSKLPSWFDSKNIIYPAKVSVEQTSSEITARYKASIVAGNIIDMTGGFGVDSFHFAKKATSVLHCEYDCELQQIAAYNFKILGADNIQSICGDSFEALENSEGKFDWIYVDPSRRHHAKGKVFMLEDCIPNVPELLTSYFEYADNILIKTAPILDLTAALTELRHVRQIHIVAVENEVKELLFEIQNGFKGTTGIRTINFLNEQPQKFDLNFDEQKFAPNGLPLKYLYEPNSAIMKSGGFDAIGIHFEVAKLHRHSHLYTSENMVTGFPGRIFEIQQIVPYQKSEVKAHLQNIQANITVRNFPLSVEALRRKWKIKDGGHTYCFFTTDLNDNKIVLICSKIKNP